MSKLATRLSMLSVCATALMLVPAVTPAKAETGRKHMHIGKHQRHWGHHVRAAWPVEQAPVVGSYVPTEPICPAIGKSFDCKIWPPPYADDPDRKTSRF